MDKSTRSTRLAHVHAAGQSVGLEGEAWAAFVERRTGAASCKDLTDTELDAFAQWWKATRPQWLKVGALCRELGMSGFEDPAFLAFVRRVTKEENPRLLNRMQLRALIAGLSNWVKSKRKRGLLPPPAAAGDPAGPAAG